MADSDSRIQTYLSVLKHANLDVDWKAFAADLRITKTGNAQRKFKEALKKDGYQYAGGQVTPLSSTEAAKATPTSSKRKKNKEPAAAAKGDETPSKKQKTKSDEDDNNDDGEQI